MKVLSQDPHQHLVKAINGNLSFGTPASQGTAASGQNIQGRWWVGTSPPTANTDFAVQHSLGYVPTGYQVFKQNKAAHIYAGVTPWNQSTLYLRADQSSVSLTLFIV